MDRPLVMAFSISLGCHALFMGIQLLHPQWRSVFKDQQALDVIYEYQRAEQELRRLQRQLESLRSQSNALPTISAPTPQIRIPDRPMAPLSTVLPATNVSRTTVVDLTNLVEAARGDPVLLSYFSAIREQIQQTANRQTWMTDEASEGLVYVSFVLNANGVVHSVTVLQDRSVPSRLLQEIAMKIIKAASPFAPFPPSLQEPSKTVVVPLEFLLGS